MMKMAMILLSPNFRFQSVQVPCGQKRVCLSYQRHPTTGTVHRVLQIWVRSVRDEDRYLWVQWKASQQTWEMCAEVPGEDDEQEVAGEDSRSAFTYEYNVIALDLVIVL